MFMRLTQIDISNRLLYCTENGFTAPQCDIVAEWLLDLEDEDGIERELDHAEIRELFTAYESIYELSEVIHARQYSQDEVLAWFEEWSEVNAANWRSLNGGVTTPLVVYMLDHCDNDVAIGSGS